LTQTNYMLKWTGNENYSQASTQTKVKMDGTKTKVKMDGKWKLLTNVHVQALTQIKVIMDRKWKLLTLFDSN